MARSCTFAGPLAGAALLRAELTPEPGARPTAAALGGLGGQPRHATTCCAERGWQEVVDDGVVVAAQRRCDALGERLDRRAALARLRSALLLRRAPRLTQRMASRCAHQKARHQLRSSGFHRLACVDHLLVDAQVPTPKLCVRLHACLKCTAGGVADIVSHIRRHSTRLEFAQKTPGCSSRAACPAGAEERLCLPVKDDDRTLRRQPVVLGLARRELAGVGTERTKQWASRSCIRRKVKKK